MSVLNNTDNNLDEFIAIVEKFLPFAKEQLEINEMPSIELISDSQNAVDLLGKTAYYDPSAQKVVVYADNRHAKDMLRSISHELVHHAQNQSGMFEGQLMMGDDYAQTNPHLREMEEDANLRGCMCVRDFVDQKIHLEETNSKRRVNSMKITEKELRATVRNLIKENMGISEMYSERPKGAPYHRDEDEYQVPTRAEGDQSQLTPEEVRAFLEATGRGSEVNNPAGYAERRTEEMPSVPVNAAEAAAAADAAEEDLGEVVEVSDEILQEARRRRARRAARRAARKAPVAPAAPAPKAEPVKAAPPAPKKEAAKKAEPKKEVIAKKAPAKEKKAVKEWYGEELFGKLLKEAVK
jgi:hypothetical protein